MGWLLLWLGVAIVLALMWFSPHLSRKRPEHTGPPGPTEGLPSDASIQSGELGRGPGHWTGSGMGPQS